MKNIFLVLISILLLASCSSSGTPENVALDFSKKLVDLDIEGAKQYATEDTKILLNAIDGLMKLGGDQVQKSIAKEQLKFLKEATCTTKGDKATCTVCCNKEGDILDNMELTLIKKEGKWLVDMKKEDAKKEE